MVLTRRSGHATLPASAEHSTHRRRPARTTAAPEKNPRGQLTSRWRTNGSGSPSSKTTIVYLPMSLTTTSTLMLPPASGQIVATGPARSVPSAVYKLALKPDESEPPMGRPSRSRAVNSSTPSFAPRETMVVAVLGSTRVQRDATGCALMERSTLTERSCGGK